VGKPAGARKLYFLAPTLSDWLNAITRYRSLKTIFMKAGYARPSAASGAWSVLHSVLLLQTSRTDHIQLQNGTRYSVAGIETEFAQPSIEIAEANEFVQIRRSSA
jgi:hypothetical protein